MNNLPYYLSRIYYSLINTTYPGYTGESAEYWSARIFYAVAGIQVTTYADGRDASFWLEKWYRYLVGQSALNPQGGQDSAVWLQKIYWHYAGYSGDAIYDGRSSEFWASLIVSLNPSNQLPPTINDAVFSVADSESVGFDVGTPTATGDDLTWEFTAGNEAGRFSINASSGLVEVADALNFWNTAQYVLTVQITNSAGSDTAQITINVTNAFSANVIQYLKLIETSGTTAFDYSSAGDRDGVYSGVTLNSTTNPGGQPAPLWDGVNDYCNLYTTALRDAFNGVAGTFSLWFRPVDGTYWDGVVFREHITIASAALANYVLIAKTNVANQMLLARLASGLFTGVTVNSLSFTAWTHLAITWDRNAGASGEFKAYIAGSQVGTTQTGLGVWGALPDSTMCVLGALNTSGGNPNHGYHTAYRLANVALPASEIAKLALEFAA